MARICDVDSELSNLWFVEENTSQQQVSACKASLINLVSKDNILEMIINTNIVIHLPFEVTRHVTLAEVSQFWVVVGVQSDVLDRRFNCANPEVLHNRVCGITRVVIVLFDQILNTRVRIIYAFERNGWANLEEAVNSSLPSIVVGKILSSLGIQFTANQSGPDWSWVRVNKVSLTTKSLISIINCKHELTNFYTN
jgi:hypothetical protein